MSKRLVIVLIVLVLLLLGLGGFALIKYVILKDDIAKESETVDEKSQDKDQNNDKTEEEDSGQKAEDDQSDWQSFSNFGIKYLIEYPKDATLHDYSDPTVDDIRYSTCLKISTEYYYVLIGAVPSEDLSAVCFRTGVGTDWINGPSDTVTAAGMEYTTEGMHSESASVGFYEDFFMISPVDGRVKIEYGTSVNTDMGTISKDEAKDIVHQIVASYNPAE